RRRDLGQHPQADVAHALVEEGAAVAGEGALIDPAALEQRPEPVAAPAVGQDIAQAGGASLLLSRQAPGAAADGLGIAGVEAARPVPLRLRAAHAGLPAASRKPLSRLSPPVSVSLRVRAPSAARPANSTASPACASCCWR